MRLANQVAIVTGDARGIGRGIAAQLSAAGAAVVIADADGPGAQRAAAELRAAGAEALGVRLDITRAAAVGAMVRRVLKQWGRIDVLVNNAVLTGATVAARPFEKLDLATWRRVIDVNLTGAFICAHACVAPMIARKSGRIIHIASINSFAAEPGCAPYVASKAGVVGLTKSMAVDLAKHNIRVNCIAPGPILTEGTGPFFASPRGRAETRRVPLGRVGRPAEIGDAVVFLASDESRYITGSVLVIDGGYLAVI